MKSMVEVSAGHERIGGSVDFMRITKGHEGLVYRDRSGHSS